MDSTGPVWSKRLKEARLAAGLSRKQLGIASGLDEFVASPRVNRYEQGVHQPDYLMSQRMAEVLNVPVAYLYCDDEKLASMLVAFHRAPLALKRQVAKALLESWLPLKKLEGCRPFLIRLPL
ncbi:MAG: helix-turn-helix transcriptional regulator [Aquabacterium sp.]